MAWCFLKQSKNVTKCRNVSLMNNKLSDAYNHIFWPFLINLSCRKYYTIVCSLQDGKRPPDITTA